jgi:stage V sporulation protein K
MISYILIAIILVFVSYAIHLHSQSQKLRRELGIIEPKLGVFSEKENLLLRDVFFENKYLFLHLNDLRQKLDSLDKSIQSKILDDSEKIFRLFVDKKNPLKQEFLYFIIEGILEDEKQAYEEEIERNPLEYYKKRRDLNKRKVLQAEKVSMGLNFSLSSLEELGTYPDVSYLVDVFFQKFALAIAILDGNYNDNDKKTIKDFCNYLYTQREKHILQAGTGLSSKKGSIKESNLLFQNLQESLDALDSLVGIQEIKAKVRSLANFIRIQGLREEKGMKTQSISLSMVFYGSPGTGKTTVARYLGEIFRHLGILEKGHLIETDREGLVAGYIGQTSGKTKEVIRSAMDGILFIDEAYALAGKNVSQNDFGQEAVDILLKEMEDHRSRLIVIVAGYEEEMKDFIDSNPGLKSRFGQHLFFPDFTDTELLEILEKTFIQKNMYRIDESVKTAALQHFQNLILSSVQNFGNARYCRNLFEFMIQAQANRLMVLPKASKEDFMHLTLSDLQEAIKRIK